MENIQENQIEINGSRAVANNPAMLEERRRLYREKIAETFPNKIAILEAQIASTKESLARKNMIEIKNKMERELAETQVIETK